MFASWSSEESGYPVERETSLTLRIEMSYSTAEFNSVVIHVVQYSQYYMLHSTRWLQSIKSHSIIPFICLFFFPIFSSVQSLHLFSFLMLIKDLPANQLPVRRVRTDSHSSVLKDPEQFLIIHIRSPIDPTYQLESWTMGWHTRMSSLSPSQHVPIP